jgi:hypothetical protein
MQPPAVTPPGQPPATEADLEAEFPGWHVWRTTDAGTWWAVRRGRAWTLPRSVAANTPEDLRARLRDAHAQAGTP